MHKIVVKKQGFLGKIFDYLFIPVMYLLQGNFREVPQRTHRWNNVHLQNFDISNLIAEKIEIVEGQPGAHQRWLGPIPLFHMPVFGGWKKFVVLKPKVDIDEWYIGWVAFDALGYSKIPLKDSVRMGLGPRQAQFFGLDKDGNQIDVDVVGHGFIGKAREFSKIPLL